jgi:hypothetical protein
MDKLKVFLLALGLCTFSSLVMAQSSGNFTYGSNSQSERCVLNNDNTGSITGGATCSLSIGNPCTTVAQCSSTGGAEICVNPGALTLGGVCANSDSSLSACTTNADCTAPSSTCFFQTGQLAGACVDLSATANNACIGGFSVGIKTSSGNGNVFVIRPSAVVGLLTDATVSKNSQIDVGTSSALAGVDFSVAVTPQGNQPNPVLTPNYSVTYDSRFVQISTNLFDALGTTCTTATGCFITFNESTVSAHSFDWIASGLASGQYNVAVSWNSALGDFGIANSMTCVGPVNLTVQQNKVFSFNTVNSF